LILQFRSNDLTIDLLHFIAEEFPKCPEKDRDVLIGAVFAGAGLTPIPQHLLQKYFRFLEMPAHNRRMAKLKENTFLKYRHSPQVYALVELSLYGKS
jgi:hypothetical protein